jgi:hypothetical protein
MGSGNRRFQNGDPESVSKTYCKEIQPLIPSDLVTVPAASRITGIRKRTIWKWITQGKVRAWGRRRCYRVSISELLIPVRSQ